MTDTNIYASETNFDTQANVIEAAYENSASYAASATLGSLIGTHIHVESEIEDAESHTLRDMHVLTTAELTSLVERDTHDWLLMS
jgi:hypothetical protein